MRLTLGCQGVKFFKQCFEKIVLSIIHDSVEYVVNNYLSNLSINPANTSSRAQEFFQRFLHEFITNFFRSFIRFILSEVSPVFFFFNYSFLVKFFENKKSREFLKKFFF